MMTAEEQKQQMAAAYDQRRRLGILGDGALGRGYVAAADLLPPHPTLGPRQPPAAAPAMEALEEAHKAVSRMVDAVSTLETRLGYSLATDGHLDQMIAQGCSPIPVPTCSSLTQALRDICLNVNGQAQRLHTLMERLEL